MGSVGSQLISELGRRRQLGMYFNYGAYRRIRGLNSLIELAQFIRVQGYECPSAPRDVSSLVDALQNQGNDLGRNPMTWAFLLSDPTGIAGLLYMPIWMVRRLFRAT